MRPRRPPDSSPESECRWQRRRLAVALEFGQVLPIPRGDAHEFQVDQHLVHLRVADALSQAERGGMNAIRARH